MDALFLGIKRLSVGVDGYGIRSLVAFHGCPLRCKYCLNSKCLDSKFAVKMTSEQIINELKKDELYYLATKGGVTFGGGEPLLNVQFIMDVINKCPKRWNYVLETSLNVPQNNLVALSSYISEFCVDIKDMNPTIYKAYTGQDNKLVKENLKWLIKNGFSKHIICRIPNISGYNTKEDMESSIKELKLMGITRFDCFTYITKFDK